jgi:hypothetical protein
MSSVTLGLAFASAFVATATTAAATASSCI